MRRRAFLALPLALPLLAAAECRAPDEIRLVPRAGLVLRKTFERSGAHEAVSFSEGGDTTSTIDSEALLVVRDVTRAADDERVTRLERTYERIEAWQEGEFEHPGGASSHSFEADSELEAATVVFAWDEEAEAYVASSEDTDDEWLADLPQDLDFGALLPGDAVEVDDGWELDLEEFEQMIDPWRGIDLDWGGEDDGQAVVLEEGDQPEVETTRAGEVRATFAGTREVDGVTVAVITLEGELETETITDAMRELGDGHRSEAHHEKTSVRTIEGEVLWNLAGGHLHSLEIELEIESVGISSNVFSHGDREFESESENESQGTLVLKARFERDEEE